MTYADARCYAERFKSDTGHLTLVFAETATTWNWCSERTYHSEDNPVPHPFAVAWRSWVSDEKNSRDQLNASDWQKGRV